MFDEETLRSISDLPGYCGPLADSRPNATAANVRPFVWAYVLFTGGVTHSDIVRAMDGLCNADDVIRYEPDSRLDQIVQSVLTEFVSRGYLELNSKGTYKLLAPSCLQKTMSVVCVLNSSLPDHLLGDLAAHEFKGSS